MNEVLELFMVFFKLGAFTIGGGIAMIPLLQDAMTCDKKWFSKEEFVDVVALCQSLPGIIAINMAGFVGYKRKGFIGSAVATIGVTLPSFVLILLIARGMALLGGSSIALGAMAALRAAALGMVIAAIVKMLPTAIKNKWAAMAAVLSFALIEFLNINTAYVILLFILLGMASAVAGVKRAATEAKAKDEASGIDERGEGR